MDIDPPTHGAVRFVEVASALYSRQGKSERGIYMIEVLDTGNGHRIYKSEELSERSLA